MKKLPLVSLAVLLLSACAPQPSELPTFRIVVSPSAQPISAAVANCVPIDGQAGFSIEMQYPTTVDLDEFVLLINLGEPSQEGVFATQLAWEEIALIVNPGNDVDISRDVAISLFRGRMENWSELGGDETPVSLWAGPESDEARQIFEGRVILGSVSGDTRVATNPDTSIAAVANDPGAIAIMPAAWADETVRQIDLDLQVPVIAVTKDEPAGPIRDLLACLQGPKGQESISISYTPFQ